MPNSEMPLREFFEKHFVPLRQRGKSFNTRRLYRTTLNSFEKHLERSATLRDLNDDTVSRFLSWFREHDGGRAAPSANKERANLLAIWRFACTRRDENGDVLVRDWPNVDVEPEPEDDPVAWRHEQVDALFQAVDRLDGSLCGIPTALWWRALHGVLWDTGERITATLRVTWADIDLITGFVRMRATTRKGGVKGRTYRLHPETIEDLKKIHQGRAPERPVFPWPYSRTYVWNHYTKILQSAGLPSDRKSKFHRMRRSVASHAEAAGLDATELLGHSRRKVTARYIDPTIVTKPQASDVLFRPQRTPPNEKPSPAPEKESPHDPGRKQRKPPGKAS